MRQRLSRRFFAKQKIVWGEISDRSKFCLDAEGKYIPEATTFLMTGSDLHYLLCVLNNPAAEWFFSKVGTTTGVGTVRWKKFTIEQLLIPRISDSEKTLLTNLVTQLTTDAADKEAVLNKINSIIFSTIGLSEEEISYVEKFYPPLKS